MVSKRGIREARGRAFMRARGHVDRLPRVAKNQVEKEFFRSAPEFFGSREPSVTWEWLMKMEGIFIEIQLKERLKVKYAVGMLRGLARKWWRSISHQKGKWEAYDMGWVTFRTLMIRRYRLKDYVERLEEEFLSFQLRRLSIEDYTQEFRRMLHLVRHLVHSGKDEVRFYALGLPEMYREYVGRQWCLDLAAICAKEVACRHVPKFEKAEEAERQRTKRFKEEGLKEEGCPRCGQPCVLILDCDCLELDCDRCGDWRHTSAKCPESA